MRKLSHISRLFLALVFALQIGLSGQIRTNAVGDYVCNPGGQPPSAETIAQIQDLFAAAGKALPEDVNPTEHCPDCLAPALISLPTKTTHFIPTAYRSDSSQAVRLIELFYSPQGPPLGCRAPPPFT